MGFTPFSIPLPPTVHRNHPHHYLHPTLISSSYLTPTSSTPTCTPPSPPPPPTRAPNHPHHHLHPTLTLSTSLTPTSSTPTYTPPSPPAPPLPPTPSPPPFPTLTCTLTSPYPHLLLHPTSLNNPMTVRQLFVLFRFASFKKWKFEVLSINKSEAGGYKVKSNLTTSSNYLLLEIISDLLIAY